MRISPPGLSSFKQHHVVAQGHQIIGHGEGCRTGADQGHPLSVLSGRSFGQEMADLPFEVGGHPLEPANGYGLITLQPPAPAGGLAGTIAGTPQDAGKTLDSRSACSVGVAPLGNQTDISRHVRVRRAGPLAIDDLVVVTGILGIGRFHLAIIM